MFNWPFMWKTISVWLEKSASPYFSAYFAKISCTNERGPLISVSSKRTDVVCPEELSIDNDIFSVEETLIKISSVIKKLHRKKDIPVLLGYAAFFFTGRKGGKSLSKTRCFLESYIFAGPKTLSSADLTLALVTVLCAIGVS